MLVLSDLLVVGDSVLKNLVAVQHLVIESVRDDRSVRFHRNRLSSIIHDDYRAL